MLFDDDGYTTKPDKRSLIRELEESLTREDYSFNHEPNSAYLIDVMVSLQKVRYSDITTFSDLLSAFLDLNKLYIQNGRCDYIFDVYSESALVKDTESIRRAKSSPVVLSTIEKNNPIPKDMSSF